MRALVFRSTHDTVGYDLFDMGENEEVLVSGSIAGIGGESPEHRYAYGGRGRGEGATSAPSHAEALERVAAVLSSPTTSPDVYTKKLTVIAHGVTHGGERFRGPALVTDEVVRAIEACSTLSPRRNPAALQCIRAARALFPGAPHVAVFDTAFHQTMPAEAFLYALPYELYDRSGIRRYGFHGVSHQHAIHCAEGLLGLSPGTSRIVSLFLGDECSATAVVGGRCVDTTTGLTAREGLPGATSSGDLDPAAVTLLMRAEGWGPDELDALLGQRSGVLGLSGVSSDLVEVLELAAKGDDRCVATGRVLLHRFARGVAAMTAAVGGMDLLVLTGAVAERSAWLRSSLVERLRYLGASVDPHRSDGFDGSAPMDITGEGARCRVVVVPGDEQRAIARESLMLVAGRDPV
ncbi:MAG: hypothetical protein R6W95_16735 [Desulfosarcina sp.]